MIGVIAPYSHFKEEVERISKSLKIQVVVEIGALRAGLKVAKKMIREQKVKVIIARGATANFLKEKLDVPIIKIDVTNFDIIKTLSEAKKVEQNIVLIDHIDNYERLDLDTIKEILKVDVVLKQYENEKDITNHIMEVADIKEQKAIVGTAECIAYTAGNRGVQTFIVFSQTDSITEALWRAKETLEIIFKEELKQKHLESIIHCAFDGVISTDESGIVTVCNGVAAKYLDIRASEIIGRNIINIGLSLFKKLLGDQKPASKIVITNGNNKYVLNRVCIGENSLVITFQEAEAILKMDTKVRSELYHRRFYSKYSFEDIIYQSPIMKQKISLARAYAKSDSNILIFGESGTGKELFAQSIHQESNRKHGPFVAVNCAALSESLLESELFGYEEGAFTGAKKGGKPGLFEMAHGGTIFLDEIGEVAPSLQARLLRVLQEKEVRRIGGERIIPVNVRVISATNKNLVDSIQTEDFRSDLYYRLNILHIDLPPLRERYEDIDLLIDKLLIKHNGHEGLIPEEIRHKLFSYHWPGNIRELENFIERVIAVSSYSHFQGEIMELLYQQESHFLLETKLQNDNYLKIKIGSLEEMETQILDELSNRYDGNKNELADKLGISRTTLWKKMKQVNEG